MTRYIVTGASGALGSSLMPRLLEAHPDATVLMLLRSEVTAQRCLAALPSQLRSRAMACVADLLNPASLARTSASLRSEECTVGIHLAADVSWEKSAEDLRPINVDGALHFARFLESVASRPRLVFVSTAFTQVGGNCYRNGYEQTKAEAELLLRETFGRNHPMNVYSCSLVIGSSRDGHIARHHGLYPLIRFLDRFSPPFLVGRKEGRFDLIPVDWAVEQLLHAVNEVSKGTAPCDVVASAGAGRIAYSRLVDALLAPLNVARLAAGQAAVAPMPILRMRQWEFLKRSVSAWQPPGVRERDFRYFERLLGIYGNYAENDAVREPFNISSSAPTPESYLPIVVDRWWRDQRAGLRNGAMELAS